MYTRAGALCAQARGKILLKQNRLKSILIFNDLQILLRQNGAFRILLRQKLKHADYQDIAILPKQNFRAWNILPKQTESAKH